MRTRITIRHVGRLAVAGLVALSLSACAIGGAGPILTPTGIPTAAPTGAPPLVPTGVPTAAPTLAPTVAPPTAPTVAPTLAPTVAPPTAVAGLVGPEWLIADQGDFDGNGRPDVVAYKPSALRPVDTSGSAAFATVVREAVIVERRPDGSPWVRVLADRDGLRIDGALVIPFGSTPPAAMLLNLDGARRQILLTPLDAQGRQYTYAIGAVYDAATGSYNRLGGEIPGARPLVGQEWTPITSGDFDRNGRTDVVAYKPVALSTGVSTAGGYLASEAVVVERAPDGSPVTRLLITRDGVIADGQPAASFGSGDQRPAGMIVRLLGDERKLVLTPLNRAGEQYAQDVAVGYVEAAGGYVVYGPGGTLPLPLVGPEWTLALGGSLNPAAREGVIAYKPAPVSASNPGPGDLFAVVASELVAVDRAPSGGPAVRLVVTLDGIAADGQLLARFGSSDARPAAIVARGSGGDRSITFSPLNAAGQQYAQDARVFWDSGAGAYRLAGPGGQPPANPVPGWTLLDSGDRNRDGLRDHVAYRPSSLTAGQPGVVASEVAIVQERPDGNEFQATVAQGAIYAGGYLIYTFTDGSGAPLPAAYLLTVSGDVVSVTGLSAEGGLIGPTVDLTWSPTVGAYVATPRPW